MRGSFGAGFSEEQDVARNKVGMEVDSGAERVIMGGFFGVG
jgi:hypothetical protein